MRVMATAATIAAAAAGGALGSALLAGCQRPPAAPAVAPATATTATAAAPGTGASGVGAARPQGASVPASVPAPARAAALAAASAAWPKIAGHWLRGDTDARFTAWFQDGELRYLEEIDVRRDAAPLHGHYYFEHGALFYYSGESPAGAAVGGGTAAMAASVPVVVAFEGAQPRQAVRVEHYGEVPLGAAAVLELQRRAAALAGLARDEWSAAAQR